MKKLFVFICALSYICMLWGCSPQTPSENASPARDTAALLVTDDGSISEESTSYWATQKYIYFEDYFSSVTDVVCATYWGTSIVQGRYVDQFEVNRWIRTIGSETTVKTPYYPSCFEVMDTDIVYSSYEIPFEKGECYLLFLDRYVSVYCDEDSLFRIGPSLVMPIDPDGKVDLSKCRLYNEELSKHIKYPETKEALGNGTFEEYLLNIVANNPQKTGETFIESNDIKTILSEADYIFGVTVIGEMDIDHAEDRNPCECRLTKVYKGSEIPESYSTGERPITVIFPGGTGAPGESYIVAVNGVLSALTMTSKYNSFYDVSMEEEIIAILAGNA